MEDLLFIGVITLLGVVAQLDWLKNWKYLWALRVIRLAVQWTYTNYVRDIKQNDRKLTSAERAEALQLAVTKAQEVARKRGINLDAIFGDMLESMVEIEVRKAK